MNLPWPLAFWRRRSHRARQTSAPTPERAVRLDKSVATAPRGSADARTEGGSRVAEKGTTRTPGVRSMPRPALRWIGPAGRIALRQFDFLADSDAVCTFQRETYELNFPDFRYTAGFADAFRYDLRRAALDPNHALFVLDEGTICGFLWLVICENSWTRERFGYVNNLYILESRRGQGLATELMRQGDSFFRSRRVSRIRLTVTASNESAVRLYERSGYVTARWEMEKQL